MRHITMRQVHAAESACLKREGSAPCAAVIARAAIREFGAENCSAKVRLVAANVTFGTMPTDTKTLTCYMKGNPHA